MPSSFADVAEEEDASTSQSRAPASATVLQNSETSAKCPGLVAAPFPSTFGPSDSRTVRISGMARPEPSPGRTPTRSLCIWVDTAASALEVHVFHARERWDARRQYPRDASPPPVSAPPASPPFDAPYLPRMSLRNRISSALLDTTSRWTESPRTYSTTPFSIAHLASLCSAVSSSPPGGQQTPRGSRDGGGSAPVRQVSQPVRLGSPSSSRLLLCW
mmetsp:Transcript_36532/g.87116  ORF Transcript_36532/g.87116 Transcript_36532/m.87116 type:complete len:217 (+) Transcript_36532:294-944(+)